MLVHQRVIPIAERTWLLHSLREAQLRPPAKFRPPGCPRQFAQDPYQCSRSHPVPGQIGKRNQKSLDAMEVLIVEVQNFELQCYNAYNNAPATVISTDYPLEMMSACPIHPYSCPNVEKKTTAGCENSQKEHRCGFLETRFHSGVPWCLELGLTNPIGSMVLLYIYIW